jgi:uncharacterized membrane protein HdeD (DUF308 family)
MLDLRLPIGWYFVITGVLLLAMGLFADIRAALPTVNVDLYCGLFMSLFGAFLLLLAARSGRRRS